jgi:hypothetical protein
MENNINKVNKEEVPVYKILKQIKDGTLQAKELSKEMRQDCVEVLTLEGYSVPSIAQLLDRSEKTVKRDLEEIWQRNSKRPTPEIALSLIAELIEKSKSQAAHLMRIARSNEGSIQERINAERLAWEIQNQTVERLQNLGYLPQTPQKIVGDIYHHDDSLSEEKTLEELKEELSQLEKIAVENGILDETTKVKLAALKLRIEQAGISKDLTQLTKEKQEQISQPKEEDNHVSENE